jgi:5'(3')-deoxyribonucleotidase
MLRIGVDVDGVLAEFIRQARLDFQKMLDGRPADSVIQTGWGFDSIGISREEERAFWKHVDETPNWWMQLGRRPGTNTLKRLCDKYRVIFITNRKDGTGLPVDIQTATWLSDNFGIAYPTVLLSDDKGPLTRALKLDWFIDDRPKNVEEVRVSSPLTRTVLYRTTYNEDYAHLDCVTTFDEFTKRFSLPEEEEGIEALTGFEGLFIDDEGNVSTRPLL